jgi:protoheme IX farnesyltransferase
MQILSKVTDTHRIRAYLSLVKPGIIFGNALTAIAGFGLAAQGTFQARLFFFTLLGLSLIIASACVYNNYIDRKADQSMQRTRHRPLAQGTIPCSHALIMGTLLGLLGTVLLAKETNFLTVLIALFGFTVYVFWYSFFKYVTVHGTLIGSIAGAVPPVVGYCAVSNHLDAGAWILFFMIAFWQMPHFFAIAIYRLDEYAAASIPVLALKKGIPTTQAQILFYLIAFTLSGLMLTLFGYTGIFYAIIFTILSCIWIGLSIHGFKTQDINRWARMMFIYSLIVVTILSVVIPFNYLTK